MKILYFGALRERIGRGSESITLPQDIKSARDLKHFLIAQDTRYQHALDGPHTVCVAIDQEHAQWEDSIEHATEVAFFPPVTGG
ncbi:MAG: molybdopterin converting factor subunit 1 [Alphaproteobacteria bacterium]|jgi:molybdopterin synthase sulfur carrier subunit